VKKAFSKNKTEIKNIKKACRISDKAFSYLLGEIRLGTSEKELAHKISTFIKAHSDGIPFKTIVAFGENSSEIHHKPGQRKLKINDPILFDFGAKVGGMCSDISRTVFFGKATGKQKRAYEAVLEAQEKTLEFLKSSIGNHKSIRGRDVDKIARDYLIFKGFPSIPHGLGHALGKKVHCAPRLSPKSKFFLMEDIVLTVEPGIYLKDFGIRIEDDVLIAKTGIKILTKSEKKIIEIKP
jgi:Xaa-Pro aminopeptidase